MREGLVHLQLSSAREGFHDLILIEAWYKGVEVAAVDGPREHHHHHHRMPFR